MDIFANAPFGGTSNAFSG